MKNIQPQLNILNQGTVQAPVLPDIPLEIKIPLCLILSASAFMARNPYTLAALLAANGAFIAFSLAKPFSIYNDLKKIFLGQTLFIYGLYVFKFGPAKGLLPGLIVSLQILCAFLPGVVLLKSTSAPQMTQFLSGIMPDRLAFVLATSLKFVPMLIEEIRSIHEVQLLRGANVRPKDILFFWKWPDFINCVIVPATLKSMAMSKEIALAAQARDFGLQERRTFWPEA